ncbi:MAG: hypothetical protein JRG73_03320 [Deltaproteobacteria bacterium]|nr:hypothetical protein [Deltaproteobacteria bacterium]MBW2305942.1 hypothetical protein [Deltaproteobacteria bacterium]
MKRTIVILTMIFAAAFSGCSGNKAKELFETAQFEELQNNLDHARLLYQEIITKYPDSECAKQAEDRLTVLQKNINHPARR